MNILNPAVVAKISKKIGKPPKYTKEQISKRARRQGILSEAAMFLWAQELKIPVSSYLRQLSSDIRAQIYNRPINNSNNKNQQPVSFRIIRIGKDENTLYNQLWFQILVIGIAVNVASQIVGTWLTNLLRLTSR